VCDYIYIYVERERERERERETVHTKHNTWSTHCVVQGMLQ